MIRIATTNKTKRNKSLSNTVAVGLFLLFLTTTTTTTTHFQDTFFLVSAAASVATTEEKNLRRQQKQQTTTTSTRRQQHRILAAAPIPSPAPVRIIEEGPGWIVTDPPVPAPTTHIIEGPGFLDPEEPTKSPTNGNDAAASGTSSSCDESTCGTNGGTRIKIQMLGMCTDYCAGGFVSWILRSIFGMNCGACP